MTARGDVRKLHAMRFVEHFVGQDKRSGGVGEFTGASPTCDRSSSMPTSMHSASQKVWTCWKWF